mgnify:CR=1 FL=1
MSMQSDDRWRLALEAAGDAVTNKALAHRAQAFTAHGIGEGHMQFADLEDIHRRHRQLHEHSQHLGQQGGGAAHGDVADLAQGIAEVDLQLIQHGVFGFRDGEAVAHQLLLGLGRLLAGRGSGNACVNVLEAVNGFAAEFLGDGVPTQHAADDACAEHMVLKLHGVVVGDDHAHLRDLIEICKEEEVRIIFVQPEFDRRNAEIIAKQTNTNIVDVNPLSYNWEKEMIHIANSLCK